MTPAEIRQLIDIHTWPACDINPATVSLLADLGLVESSLESVGKFQTTERGIKMVEMLCATPLPEQQWVDPRGEK